MPWPARASLLREFAPFASPSYVSKHGRPKSDDNYDGHVFLGLESVHECSPCGAWIRAHAPESNITFRSTSTQVLEEALLSGLGIGVLSAELAHRYGERVELIRSDPNWTIPIWLVTHVDLHRSAKVQAFTSFLKRAGYLTLEVTENLPEGPAVVGMENLPEDPAVALPPASS